MTSDTCVCLQGALQRLQDQLTELRAQGGVQRVVEAEEALSRSQVELQNKDNHLLALQVCVWERETAAETERGSEREREEQTGAFDDSIPIRLELKT